MQSRVNAIVFMNSLQGLAKHRHLSEADYFQHYKNPKDVSAALETLRLQKHTQAGSQLLALAEHKRTLRQIIGYEKIRINHIDVQFMLEYLSLFPIFQEIQLNHMDEVVVKTLIANCQHLFLQGNHLEFDASHPDLFLLISGKCLVSPPRKKQKRDALHLDDQSSESLIGQVAKLKNQLSKGQQVGDQIEMYPSDYYGLLFPAIKDKYDKKNKLITSQRGCEMLRIPYPIVNMIANRHFARKQSQVLPFFQNINLFKGVSLDSLKQLISKSTQLQFIYKQVIYEKGQQSNHIYFIYRGSVLIQNAKVPSQQMILREKQYFGYQELVKNINRECSAVCNANDTLIYQVEFSHVQPILVSMDRVDVLQKQSLLYDSFMQETHRTDTSSRKIEVVLDKKQELKQKIQYILNQNKKVLVVKKEPKRKGAQSSEGNVSNFQLTEYMMKQTQIAEQQTKIFKIKERRLLQQNHLDLVRGKSRRRTHAQPTEPSQPDDMFILSSNKLLLQRTPRKETSRPSFFTVPDSTKTLNFITQLKSPRNQNFFAKPDTGPMLIHNYRSTTPRPTNVTKKGKTSSGGKDRLMTQQP